MEKIQFIDDGLSEEERIRSLEAFERWSGLARFYWQKTGDKVVDLRNINEYFIKVVECLVNDKEFIKDLSNIEFLAANYYRLMTMRETEEFMDIIDEAYILSSFPYYEYQAPAIASFMINYDDIKKQEIFGWLKQKSRFYLYNSLLGSVINGLRKLDNSAVYKLEILVEKMKQRTGQLPVLINDENQEKSLAKITNEEFDFLIKDFFKYIKSPASWEKTYEEIKASKLLQFSDASGKSRGVCYFNLMGNLRISLERTGTIDDVSIFIHEFTHYMALQKRKEFSILEELITIYMEIMAGEYLEVKVYGEDLGKLFLTRHRIDDDKTFMANELFLKDLIDVLNGKVIINENNKTGGEPSKSGKVRFERRRESLDWLMISKRDRICDLNTEKILKDGLGVLDCFKYFLGTMVTEELVERPKEEVLPVMFDIIDNIQDYSLDRAIESLDIKCLEQDTEENKKDLTRSLKRKQLS